jgi:hypothetical protein
MNCDTVRELAPAFVLGALTRSEEQAVRDHLATCREPHPEFEVFGGVVPYFGETVELIEPPASLKERVLAAVAAEPQPREASTVAKRATASDARRAGDLEAVPVAARPLVTSPPARAAEAVPARVGPRRASPLRWVVAIAAVLAIVGLAGWNVLLQTQLASATAYDRAVSAVLDVAARSDSQTAILSADGGGSPRGIAAVGSDGSVALAMQGLAPTVGSEVYEAWAIAPGAAPVPIGAFQVAADGTGSLTGRAAPASGATISLTREPGPGATAPTSPVVAKGVAMAPPPP